ncbi:MAG: winged helix-turn-helix transcriptional regulator [Oscillospiraceae bacterium]|nr:winged helix-turn-helix transcriptional regulator [Oscillospiraceae bacterium]
MLERFEKFTQSIGTAYKYIGKIKSNHMSSFDLKGSHVMCIFFLGRNPEGLKANQLCELCQEDKGAVSKTLNTLKKRGLVESSAGRLRKYRAVYKITQEGMNVFNKVTVIIEDAVKKCSDDLTEEERSTFYSVLDKIIANLSKIM